MVRIGLLFILLQVLFTPALIYSIAYRMPWRENASIAWLTLGWMGVVSMFIAAVLRW